jgi:hypothetical protein
LIFPGFWGNGSGGAVQDIALKEANYIIDTLESKTRKLTEKVLMLHNSFNDGWAKLVGPCPRKVFVLEKCIC